MLSLTEDQRYFMDILETAGFVRTDQVLPLLRINEPQKELKHVEAILCRLRYLGRLTVSIGGWSACRSCGTRPRTGKCFFRWMFSWRFGQGGCSVSLSRHPISSVF